MLEKKLKELDQKLKGKLGICVEWLDTGQRWGLRERERFPTASVIKVPILAALYEKVKQERLDLKGTLTLKSRGLPIGSGILRHLSPGLEIPLKDLAVLMIILSDNAATNMLIDFLGLKYINSRIKAWGYTETILWRKINFNINQTDPCWLGESTPRDTTDLLARIAKRNFLGKKYDRTLEEILTDQKYQTALPRLLPGNGDWDKEQPEFVVAHKTGSIEGVRADVGIITSPIGRYVISVYSKDLKDSRSHPDNQGTLAIAEVSREVYRFLKRKFG